jgi:hypothetical protein
MGESNNEKPRIIEVPSGNGRVHIHLDQDELRDRPRDGAIRNIGSWIAGGLGAMAGWLGGEAYTANKMLEFDTEVSNLVRNDIMRPRGGTGAAMDSVGSAFEHAAPFSGFGPGAASHEIKAAHELNLIKSGKFPFARFVKVVGSWPITMTAAIVAGGAALTAYLALAPKKKEEPEEKFVVVRENRETESGEHEHHEGCGCSKKKYAENVEPKTLAVEPKTLVEQATKPEGGERVKS